MKIGRDWHAVDAHFRRGGPMKHKNTPRGGSQNESRDLLAEAEQDDAGHTHDSENQEGLVARISVRHDREEAGSPR